MSTPVLDIRKILMPTDFSDCSKAAFTWALFLAEQLDADLDLLHVVVLHGSDALDPGAQFPDADDIYLRLQQIASSEMKQLLSERRTDHLNIEVAQRRDVAAAPGIVRYADEESVGLIVMGAHGHRGFRRFLLGSVAEEVARLASCPVLTLRSENPYPEIEKIEKIVVPYDFSESSRSGLAVAKDLAAIYGSRLYLVHVIEPVMAPHPYVPLHYKSAELELPQLTKRVEEELRAIAAERLGDAEVEIVVLEGGPGWRIPEYAEEVDADLIVLATHGRTGLARFFLGSVTEKVVRSAECPVLTVKVGEAEADAS